MTVAEHEAVANGAELLDSRGPEDWVSRIDLDRLNIESVTDCVLGQLYGESYLGFNSLLTAEEDRAGDRIQWGYRNGFIGTLSTESWDVLTETWRELIEERRRQDD